MTLLLVVLALTWCGLATWIYFDNRACRRCLGTGRRRRSITGTKRI